MPSGKVHDWVTLGTALGAIPLTGLYLPPEARPLAWLAIASYAFSGIWLSSDLDVNSSAYRRWGPLARDLVSRTRSSYPIGAGSPTGWASDRCCAWRT
jgi:hypothetical protein